MMSFFLKMIWLMVHINLLFWLKVTKVTSWLNSTIAVV